jgi:hypothetical protein
MKSSTGTRLTVVVSGLLAIVSLCVAAVGVFGLYANRNGYVDLGHATYRTDSYAVVSEPHDWSTETFLFGKLGKVRVKVTPAAGSAPTFVGMAPAQSVFPYLDGVGYVIARGAHGQVKYESSPGGAPSSSSLVPWMAKATGTQTLTLRFPANMHGGDTVLVAMHADRSADIAGRVTTQATVPSLGRNALIALLAGLAVFIGSAWLMVAAIRGGRKRRAAGGEAGRSDRQPSFAASNA